MATVDCGEKWIAPPDDRRALGWLRQDNAVRATRLGKTRERRQPLASHTPGTHHEKALPRTKTRYANLAQHCAFEEPVVPADRVLSRPMTVGHERRQS